MKDYKIYEKGAESWDYFVVSFASREDFTKWFSQYKESHINALFKETTRGPLDIDMLDEHAIMAECDERRKHIKRIKLGLD